MRPLTAREDEEDDDDDAASGLDDEADEPKEPEGSCRGAGRRDGPMMTGCGQGVPRSESYTDATR